MVKVAVAHCLSGPYVYGLMYKSVLDIERRQIREIAETSPFPVIIRHIGYSSKDGGVRSRSTSCLCCLRSKNPNSALKRHFSLYQ